MLAIDPQNESAKMQKSYVLHNLLQSHHEALDIINEVLQSNPSYIPARSIKASIESTLKLQKHPRFREKLQ